MKRLLKEWRKFLHSDVDVDVISHISETVETLMEIPVKNMYVGENSRHIKVLLNINLEEHAPELMELVKHRWHTSYELQELQQMGYDIEFISPKEDISSYYDITKQLL